LRSGRPCDRDRAAARLHGYRAAVAEPVGAVSEGGGPGIPPDDAIEAAIPSGPVPSSRGGESLLDLVRVMARLRGPDGCPWDAQQDHRSLARHLLEEAHEVLDAIDDGDDDRLRDELGDLLLQVVFHARMAADEGRWDVDDVADGIVRKLIRRHP